MLPAGGLGHPHNYDTGFLVWPDTQKDFGGKIDIFHVSKTKHEYETCNDKHAFKEPIREIYKNESNTPPSPRVPVWLI